MNAEEHDQKQTGLPVGLALPADHQQAREAIAEALEQEMAQAASNAFLAELLTRRRVAAAESAES